MHPLLFTDCVLLLQAVFYKGQIIYLYENVTIMTEKTVHEGRNVKRIREILGIKQDVLALELGLSQQAVSALEQKEALDKDVLEKIAKALKVTPDVIKGFNEDATINIISSTLHDNAGSIFNNAVFNPIDKWIESIEENKKLYERLLQTEREKVQLLEKMLNIKN
jgi:transcriptional regulator with XRE-family HTH domain